MFFNKRSDALRYARIEEIITHKKHIVIPCKKPICPINFSQFEYKDGYTIRFIKE